MRNNIIHGYNLYNPYNLISDFKLFLQSKTNSKVTIKNYLSDLRYFIGWLISVKGTEEKKQWKLNETSFETLKDYKNYLIGANLPIKTVNRRLSSLRLFCVFCLEKKVFKKNIAIGLTNASSKESVMEDFKSYLKEQKIDNEEIDQLELDIREFFNFSRKNPE